MHSLGMGFTVSDGVEARAVQHHNSTVYFNESEIEFPTVRAVVTGLAPTTVRVDLRSELPLSSGFGLSGASALATAFAVNKLFSLGKSEEELAMLAHVAEVENLTGLGDVCGQYHGGCLAKLEEGHPLAAVPLPVEEQPIYYRYFGPISTREILRDPIRKASINQAAERALVWIKEMAAQPSTSVLDFPSCISISKTFAVDSGLLEHAEVRDTIRHVEDGGGSASMIMLGNAVFSDRSFPGARQTTLAKRRVTLVQ